MEGDREARFTFEEYLSVYENNWKPFEDVVPCLQELTTYKLGIISNGDLEQQSLKLERMGIKHFFSEIITAGEDGIITKLHRGKGHTESVLFSYFELLFDTIIGLLTKDLLPGAGSIALIMVVVGFLMMIINTVQLVGGLGVK